MHVCVYVYVCLFVCVKPYNPKIQATSHWFPEAPSEMLACQPAEAVSTPRLSQQKMCSTEG